MSTRPTVTIASAEGKPSGSTHPLPDVFKAPIRPDIVQYGGHLPTCRGAWADDNIGAFTLEWPRTSVSRMP